jgi:hypothetical protein
MAPPAHVQEAGFVQMDYFWVSGDPDGNPEFAFQALDSRLDLSLIENRQGVNWPHHLYD